MASIGYQRPVSKETFNGELSKFMEKDERVLEKRSLEPLDALILSNLFSSNECDILVQKTEEMRYSFWNAENPEKKDFRNADTVEVHDPELAECIWQRVKEFFKEHVDIKTDELRWERGLQGEWRAMGVNPRLLFARYESGGHFSPHTDGYTIMDMNHRSLYTFLIYLNDCPDGGATRMFMPDDNDARNYGQDEGGRMRWAEESVVGLAPVVRGTALAFYQNIPHEGQPVGAGCAKYIIRTDIMFEDLEAYDLFREAEMLEAEGQAAKAMALFRKCVKMSPALAELLGM